MSINIQLESLNNAGQIMLATFSSLIVNVISHPIGTIQTRKVAQEVTENLRQSGQIGKVGRGGLYRGYWAIFGVDAAIFTIAYLTHDALRSHLSPAWAAMVAGLVASPAVAFGEGLMKNRQLHALPYKDFVPHALRRAGVIATIGRDVPFTWTVFYLTPFVQNHLLQQSSLNRLQRQEKISPPAALALQLVLGATIGFAAGIATAPMDLVKTLIQTSETELPLRSMLSSVWSRSGWKGFWEGGAIRGIYIAIATASLNAINHSAPQWLPKPFKVEE